MRSAQDPTPQQYLDFILHEAAAEPEALMAAVLADSDFIHMLALVAERARGTFAAALETLRALGVQDRTLHALERTVTAEQHTWQGLREGGSLLRPRPITAMRHSTNTPVPTTRDRGPYLSDLDPAQRRREERRAAGDRIARKLRAGGALQQHLARRMALCSAVIEMGRVQDPSGKERLQIKSRWRCRGRYCPECAYVRSFVLQQRLEATLADLLKAYPTARFLLLDLTVKNCPVTALRATLDHMSAAWQRLTQRACWPALGWIRTMEVTHGAGKMMAHPHFHCILMVPAGYGESRSRLTHKQWMALWQECLRATYPPRVLVQLIAPEELTAARLLQAQGTAAQGQSTPRRRALQAALGRVMGYVTKPSESEQLFEDEDDEWLLILVERLHSTRAFASGKALRRFLKIATERMKEDVARLRAAKPGGVRFTWSQHAGRYHQR